MKNLTAMILALAMLCAVSCTGNTNTTVGDGTMTSRIETTATTAPAPTLPEFDINSEECLMFRLLDMTYEEIEAEFGEMTRYAIIGGGTPCYELPECGIHLQFGTYPDVLNAPLPRDVCPEYIETAGYESLVYPGIYVGMASNELIDKIGIDGVSYGMSDYNDGFASSYLIEGYWVSVMWDVPEERENEVAAAIIWGEESEEETAKAELIADMRSGDANVKVKQIRINIGK